MTSRRYSDHDPQGAFVDAARDIADKREVQSFVIVVVEANGNPVVSHCVGANKHQIRKALELANIVIDRKV